MMLEDVALFLHNNGIGVYNPTGNTSTIFIGTVPPNPDTMIALEEYIGVQDRNAWTLDGSALPQYELPRLHVTTRGKAGDYTTPRTTIEKIYQLLLKTVDRPLFGATQYNRFTPIGSGVYAMPVNTDPNRRRLFTCNFEVMKGISALT